ncbi:hypothetical protein Tco_1415691, partial [Tanacetum coccineum]
DSYKDGDGDGDASFQLKSDSLPHAHAQTTKTYYKHQDSRKLNGSIVIRHCLAHLNRVWICYLMRLFYSLLLGAPIGVKTILIGSLG